MNHYPPHSLFQNKPNHIYENNIDDMFPLKHPIISQHINLDNWMASFRKLNIPWSVGKTYWFVSQGNSFENGVYHITKKPDFDRACYPNAIISTVSILTDNMENIVYLQKIEEKLI